MENFLPSVESYVCCFSGTTFHSHFSPTASLVKLLSNYELLAFFFFCRFYGNGLRMHVNYFIPLAFRVSEYCKVMHCSELLRIHVLVIMISSCSSLFYTHCRSKAYFLVIQSFPRFTSVANCIVVFWWNTCFRVVRFLVRNRVMSRAPLVYFYLWRFECDVTCGFGISSLFLDK